MLAGSSLGNSAERVLGTRNPCHRQYTSNSCLFLYRVDHGGSAMVNSIAVVSVLSFVGFHDVPDASKTLIRVYWHIKEISLLSNSFPSIVVYVCL